MNKLDKNKNFLLSPKLKREIMLAERFVVRMKATKEIPLRTLVMMGKRLSSLHKKIKLISELRELEKGINAALLEIARAKVHYERTFVKKKKTRTFGDSAMNQKQR